MAGSKLFASIIKELLLLLRDSAGMILLFVMPAFLVIVITLIQDKVTTTTADVLFVDNDKGWVSFEIRKLLNRTDVFQLIESLDGNDITSAGARRQVASGQYQFAIILPKGLSKKFDLVVQHMVSHQLFPERPAQLDPVKLEISVLFDPTVEGSFRAALNSALAMVVKGIQARLFAEKTFDMLPEKMVSGMPAHMASFLLKQKMSARDLLPQLFDDVSLIIVQEKFTTEMGFIRQPTAVQQNVPAWAIFGIFFIAIPLAGSLIHERETGTLLRLKVMPVSYLTIISGKVLAYALVCIVQFACIVAAGIYVLPLLGLPAFDPGNQPVLFALVLSGVIAAACGYGILLGTLGRTYEQIAVFAPVSIVIAAAIGGIMVPVYALPDMIRSLCLFSPLYWGQSGFYDLLLRQGNLQMVLPEVLSLFGFCLCAISCSVVISRRRGRLV